MAFMQTVADLIAGIERHFIGQRLLVALAGPPAAGKSTLARIIVEAFNAKQANIAKVIPMDGFHLDNRLLAQRGLLPRKGAPETFDAMGFVHLIQRLKTEDEVVIPLFDRSRDIAIAGAEVVKANHRVLVVEGNYLLLQQNPWQQLQALWDLSIWLEVNEDVLQQRLIERWLSYGFSEAEAKTKARLNDLPNAQLVVQASSEAVWTWQGSI